MLETFSGRCPDKLFHINQIKTKIFLIELNILTVRVLSGTQVSIQQSFKLQLLVLPFSHALSLILIVIIIKILSIMHFQTKCYLEVKRVNK